MVKNKSVFFVPIWFDRFDRFISALQNDPRLTLCDKKKFAPEYLLKYASRIAEDDQLFRMFQLKDPISLGVYIPEYPVPSKPLPNLDEVRISCFSTGIGFLEFWISYEGYTPADITNFSYRFKKTKGRKEDVLPSDQKKLYDVARQLLPPYPEAEFLFLSDADFKSECQCFHMIHLDEKPDEDTKHLLSLLSRSYRVGMEVSQDSEYDMEYSSGKNDFWAGSSEGLVNVTFDFDAAASDWFLHEAKPKQLQKDYYFMYLLLLNQRFASIQYINLIARGGDGKASDMEALNQRIVDLKIVFSFNVISDDKIYQNVYSEMHRILMIKSLLEDIVENEGQMELLRNAESAKTEKKSGKFLNAIAVLSIFSASIDLACMVDRFGVSQVPSTVCSILLIVGVVAWFFYSYLLKK